MTFSDQDIKSNQPIPLDQVRVGSIGDARWRMVSKDIELINRLDAMVPLPRYSIKGK